MSKIPGLLVLVKETQLGLSKNKELPQKTKHKKQIARRRKRS
jgi:hypothetical protein